MKFTTGILVLIFVLMIAGLVSSNVILKKQYDTIDKSDIYWTYNKVLEQPFKYLNITGGNETNIYYEPSAKPSLRLLQEWVKYHNGEVKANVRNDTLFLNFDYKPASPFEKIWLQRAATVRIFSPELLSVTGNNTHFEMQKVKQKNISVSMHGTSGFEVESMYPEFDSINVFQSDSSAVKFEMSPDYKETTAPDNTPVGKIEIRSTSGAAVTNIPQQQNNFDESMSIKFVTANLKNHSILDIGHAQIQSLQLHIEDSSAIVVSGGALKKLNGDSLHKKL
jgi:hypothetical protein